MSIREGSLARRGAEPNPHHAPRLPRADQAAGDRAAAGHRDPGDAAGRPRHRDPLLILNTLVGGLLAAGGRQHAELRGRRRHRQADEAHRAPAAGPGSRADAAMRWCSGWRCRVGSFFWLWWTTNLLSALLAVATIAFYVFVYTLLLKRRTSQNVVWGGAAGCMPVMIGWSAVTGTIAWPALVMFAIIFFWTPPHTWALAMRYKEDYQAAGVPMLPAVATERQVTKQILIYTWLTVLATLALALATGLAVRVGRGAGRRVVPGDGPPAVRRGARAASRSSRCGCSCSRTTTWPWCSARWRSTRRWRCRRCLQSERARSTSSPDNFIRAETDMYFGNIAGTGGLGRFVHFRELSPLDNQLVVRPEPRHAVLACPSSTSRPAR